MTSDLGRAVTTAEAICAGRDLVLERDPSLREMGFGAWEGLTWDEIVARWPGLDATYGKSPRHYTPEGGESWEELCARIDGALRRIVAGLAPGGRGLIVSHAGVMHAIVHAVTATGAGDDGDAGIGITFLPASILRLRGSFADGWTLTSVNETADSRGEARTPGG